MPSRPTSKTFALASQNDERAKLVPNLVLPMADDRSSDHREGQQCD
jgi:hypothetical protein